MLISAEDAKKQWCPFSRVAAVRSVGPSAGPPAHNRVQVSSSDGKKQTGTSEASDCLADGCMAWRWAGWRTKFYDTIAPDPADDNKAGERLGYCGLANKPHGAP